MHPTTIKKALLAATGLVSGAAVVLGGAIATTPAPAHTAATRAVAAPTTAERTAGIRSVRVRLAALEQQADAAGRTAAKADEAVLQSDTAAHRAAADRAEQALQTLATAQTPELTRLLARLSALGVSADAQQGDGATATTAALVGRTRALRAVSYARKQIGDPYRFAQAGPGSWDCSGLTMGSYRAVHVAIGGHSSTAQWRKAKLHHRLHLYKHKKPGDLIFYGRPYSVYHVAIYVGHGRMIEAPYPGKRVREVPVRSADRLKNVGRPS